MSSISSQELAASASGSNEPECEPSRSARLIPTVAQCSPSTGLTSPVTMTSRPETSLRARPMLSAGGFLVRTSARLAAAPDLPASVLDFGGNSYEPFAWFDRASQSWRTWQRCLVEGWEQFSGTWPRSGMTRNGIAFRRAPLVPLTDEIASGLLPTPEASNTKAVALRSAGRSPRNFLAPLWPTPTINGNYNRKGASATSGDGLATAVKNRMWPTPSASDNRDRGNLSTPAIKRRVEKGKQVMLSMSVSDQSGQLNPTWVEWLMGFPLGWTGLKDWATQSSRKSRKQSGELS